jgi:uncharacterized membrane protein
MTFIEPFRWAHIAAGFVALAVFWIPLVAKKGASVHVRVGWVYVSAMIAVAITAAFVCGYRIAFQPARRDVALFLLLISLLAATLAVGGVLALRERKRTTRRLRVLVLPVLLVLASIAVEIHGLGTDNTLLKIFPLVALASGAAQLAYWLRPPRTRMQWWLQHMSSMGGACITTITAFFVVNASHLGLGVTSLVAWFAPGVVGGVGMSLWTRYYRKRFTSRDTSRSRTG